MCSFLTQKVLVQNPETFFFFFKNLTLFRVCLHLLLHRFDIIMEHHICQTLIQIKQVLRKLDYFIYEKIHT